MDHITQGTVIYGLRSDKYPEVACYAVIISARCDIANDKIDKLYYLTAVNVRDWFCTECGFKETYGKFIADKRRNFINLAEQNNLNGDVLLGLQPEQVMTIFQCTIEKKSRMEQMIKAYNDVRTFLHSKSLDERKCMVRSKRDRVTVFLEELSKGNSNHYFFMPQAAYLQNDVKSNGLMVDLQEIGIMTLNDAKRIRTPGIDYRMLPDESEERNRQLRTYWLEADSDFVEIEGHIQSPWCELLMQRFSKDFLRIGVDGPTKTDHEELADQIGKG